MTIDSSQPLSEPPPVRNYDARTVEGFGHEWSEFDQSALDEREQQELFAAYFSLFPWAALPADAVGFDLGCGTGRWAKLVAPKVARLYCIDASGAALAVAQRNLAALHNCEFIEASVDELPLMDDSQDFGYSLGVLHHVPDTAAGIKACARKLKPGAPFLIYLYYAFDNRPAWFRLLWRASDTGRRTISRLPFRLRRSLTDLIALSIYWPLARTARALEDAGRNVDAFPLAIYRRRSFYTMRTDALDRFGTSLEQRFTAAQIKQMMTAAGLERIAFRDAMPYWCAIGYKR
ncbi:MAG TPA: class I SAM-dependent methyltransferase [Pyrinomonadaceae bacterium]|jgi:ubiquinone/menaquinone biosynthesis C-methylase UbiE